MTLDCDQSLRNVTGGGMGNLGLDIQGGAALANLEMYGDWYRDPWGWPELTAPNVAELDAEEHLYLRADGSREIHLDTSPTST